MQTLLDSVRTEALESACLEPEPEPPSQTDEPKVLNVRCNACDRSIVGVSACDSKCGDRKDCGLRPILAVLARSKESEIIISDLMEWSRMETDTQGVSCRKATQVWAAASKWMEKSDG